ncbi:nucleoside-diphosphate kinase [Ruficoccus amylovorans]|uniref:Nucleoside diphosphate kinase n=1 Tax=Ruficoccus amylovorans TaxID=1804625 RepID=A0A842HG80_9BACT|nr:nucleoside-diphosphate kinase [Ruficoccus amylovorans]MBC2594261.1 nucleoside-diphosphate kinase [Ruficoccus amylovorans]
MQKTLIILKPDCMERKLWGIVLDRFAKVDLDIVACKMMKLDQAVLREHYSHIADKPFFPEIENFMSSRPVIAMILKGPEAISRVRSILGPTDSKAAPAGTIRGDMGADKMFNLVHASDSPEAAEAEIERFFGGDPIFE